MGNNERRKSSYSKVILFFILEVFIVLMICKIVSFMFDDQFFLFTIAMIMLADPIIRLNVIIGRVSMHKSSKRWSR